MSKLTVCPVLLVAGTLRTKVKWSTCLCVNGADNNPTVFTRFQSFVAINAPWLLVPLMMVVPSHISYAPAPQTVCIQHCMWGWKVQKKDFVLYLKQSGSRLCYIPGCCEVQHKVFCVVQVWHKNTKRPWTLNDGSGYRDIFTLHRVAKITARSWVHLPLHGRKAVSV